MAGNTVYVQGSYVDVHDNEVVNLSIDKAGEVHVEGTVQPGTVKPADGSAQPAAERPLTERQQRIRQAVEMLRAEGELRFGYDYAWLQLVMNQEDDCPHFEDTVSFLKYLRQTGLDGLPSPDSIWKKVAVTRQAHPHWTFGDTGDATETLRRNNVASRFLHCLRTETRL